MGIGWQNKKRLDRKLKKRGIIKRKSKKKNRNSAKKIAK